MIGQAFTAWKTNDSVVVIVILAYNMNLRGPIPSVLNFDDDVAPKFSPENMIFR